MHSSSSQPSLRGLTTRIPANSASHARATMRVLWAISLFTLLSILALGFEQYCMRFDSMKNYRGAVASSAGWLARLAGYEVSTSGTLLSTSSRMLQVTPECAALDALGIYCAGLIAIPTSLRRRLWGLAIGLTAIAMLNIARIAVLASLAAAGPSWFDRAHEALMHIFPVISVLPAWLLWLAFLARRNVGTRNAATSVSQQVLVV